MAAWRAATSKALDEISSLVHDAWFDFDGVRHDETNRTLIVPFFQDAAQVPVADDASWLHAPEPKPTRSTWRYREERVPFMQGTLRINAVESVALDERAGDAATLLGIACDGAARHVVVRGLSGDLCAVVSELDVTAELGNEVGLCVRRRRGLFGGVSEKPLWGSPR